MRLIDADELKEAMLAESDWWENADVWVAHNVIDQAPTIELVKCGKWISICNSDGNECSVCGHKYFGGLYAFCPCCGAKMESDNE